MSVKTSCALIALAGGIVLTSTSVSFAQWLPTTPFCTPCAAPVPTTAVYSQPAAVCPQPIAQPVYRTVPVTEYRQVKRIVKRPVIETKYVEQPVTEYRPVVETRTADVQTIEYQDVIECRTVVRNAGYWATRYQPVPRVSPCEYDNRPDLLGFLNRLGYTVQMAFTPPYVAVREYVPQTVVQNIPVRRRIAIPKTKKITYNVTRYVPYTTTRKVAVNTVRYVDEEVVALEPVTVMKTVAVGTRLTYAYPPIVTGGTQLAIRPSPDPISSSAGAKTSPTRSANSQNRKYPAGQEGFVPRKQSQPKANNRVPAKRSSLTVPLRRSAAERVYQDQRRVEFTSPRNTRLPSVVRVSGWRARRHASGPLPSRNPSPVTVADSSP
ncbi:MAG: hypothetical protein GXP27_01010 [Planctomycetes bacterium]|nr:hypothetical protein [Planctomycetota bacterium]